MSRFPSGSARHGQRGFTLLEVVIALAILALSLSVLLESQASSLANAARSRDLSIATLLARSKMIDVEQELFDEGFTVGDVEDEGDFAEEGWKDFKWKYKVTEVEMDLSSLGGLCDGIEADEGGGDCAGALGGFGGGFGNLTEEIARSVRVVDLLVSWPSGKYTQSMSVRAMVTRDDFNLQPDIPFGGDLSGTSTEGAP